MNSEVDGVQIEATSIRIEDRGFCSNRISVVKTIPHSAQVSDCELSEAQIDVIEAHAVTAVIIEEQVMQVNIMPIVEPLTGPDGDLRCALDEILCLDKRLPQGDLGTGVEL